MLHASIIFDLIILFYIWIFFDIVLTTFLLEITLLPMNSVWVKRADNSLTVDIIYLRISDRRWTIPVTALPPLHDFLIVSQVYKNSNS